MHTNYQPARKGVYAAQIEAARALREAATKRAMADLPAAYKATSGSLRSIPIGVHETLETHRAIAEHREWALHNHCAHQRQPRNYSDRGDFTRCYRGGF